jgi:hypothetical protein
MRRITGCVVLFLFHCFGLISATAQTCIPAGNAAQNAAGINPTGTDGNVHVTYDFVDGNGNVMTPDPNVAAAVAGAINQWNGVSATSHVQF